MKREITIWLVCLSFCTLNAQDSLVMSFNEYLGYVKRYHPIVKQANLTVNIGQANLMRSRGGFDPKVEIDYDRKQFKDTEYYDRLNTTFKIPTWYGVELKGNFQRNEGEYLDNSETLPEDGLYSAGVAMALGQGLWINERMATLKRARFFLEQSKADRDILVNQILYEASRAYFDWLLAYNERQLYLNFLQNAEIRFNGIKSSALAGDIAAIDTVEAKIVVQDRSLGLEQAKVRYMKSSLTLSNFLWLGENTPVELQSNMKPDTNLKDDIDSTLEIMGISLDSFALENHPKIKSLGFKIRGLQVDKNLKANKLLPTIDLEYNFLTETPDRINSFETFNYKGGLRFVYPLFLRKERGDLKLARYQLQDAQYDFDNTKIAIKNKILAIYNELESFTQQNQMIEDIVENYETLLAAEERKYSFGESSLFLINTRENRLIDAELKQLDIEYKFYNAKAMLFNNLALNPLNL